MALSCEPSDLLAAAKCFMCMDRQTAASVAVLSLVAYANADLSTHNVLIGEGGEDILGEGGENITEQ